ncbi:BQ2448_7621 [Microbotryum intermedium]|uniref:BQ2448_7621 protein n=1 Tax=Microbotryum intermedium TaxID=269621 RepID=A0A238FLE5_9BASI|nr:BQ2448_7621 [Microbotryum intermedium]
MAAPQYTPSSEIIHLVHTFSDTLDALPPALTRSISDLKELDAVLSGSLNVITTKLQKLLTMMTTTPSSSVKAAGDDPDRTAAAAAACTPYDRLRLLREVTEDARVFRLGGEDKIRVATSTCETVSPRPAPVRVLHRDSHPTHDATSPAFQIATHQNHLATLSTLLLEFLPALMLPTLPAPSAPHGYPQSNTADTAIQRRQMMSAAMGMARDLYEATSSRNTTLGNGSASARTASSSVPSGTNAATGASGGGGGSHKKPRAQNAHAAHAEKVASKHPNQYTKKRVALAQQTAQANATGVHTLTPQGGVIASAPAVNAQAGVYAHSASFGGMTAVEAVKEKRRLAGTSSSTGVDYAQSGGLYLEEHATPQNTTPRVGGKRKGEDGYGARKKSKKTYVLILAWTAGCFLKMLTSPPRRHSVEASPDPTPRTLPTATTTTTTSAPTTTTKTARRAATSAISAIKDSAIDPFGMNAPEAVAMNQQATMSSKEADLGDDDETDKTLYCLCQRPSFGEMIACDGTTCPHEWVSVMLSSSHSQDGATDSELVSPSRSQFHLDCLKMSSAPKGSWFCDFCRAEKEKKKGGRR